jgi:hypothetical protein
MDWAEYGRIGAEEIAVTGALRQEAGSLMLDLSFTNKSARPLHLYEMQADESLLSVAVNGAPVAYAAPAVSLPPSLDLYRTIAPGETYVMPVSLRDYFGLTPKPGDAVTVHYANPAFGADVSASLTIP